MCFANATSTAQRLLFYSVVKSNTLTNKFGLVSVAVCALMLGLGHNASATPHAMPPSISLAIGDGHELGFVNFGILPQAVLAGHVNGTSTSINLGAGGLYTYLFAKYDGPNYGSEVWYVGDLSGIIEITATAGGYGLFGWTLFGTGVPGVPDGGITAILLGTALGELGLERRFLLS